MLALIIGMFFIALPGFAAAAENSDALVAALASSPSVSGSSALADKLSKEELSPSSSASELSASADKLSKEELSLSPSTSELSASADKLSKEELSPSPSTSELSASADKLGKEELNPSPSASELSVPEDKLSKEELNPSPSTSELSASADELSEEELNPSPFTSELLASADELNEEESYHVPIILNDSVESYIEFFLGRGKNMFQQWLDNSAPFLPQMKEIFRSADLPGELVYVAMIESGLDPDAVFRAKATGPWQFMPDTARRYGLRNDWWVDERKEIIKSTRAAALFFRDLHDHLGSWPLVLAAYNAGAGKVQRAILRTGSADFWDLKYSTRLRRETKNFVPKFMAAAIIARDPAAYGFRRPVARPVRFDEVVIRNSMDLEVVAYCADSTYKTIKSLNPELTGRSTPPDDHGYVLKIPEGKTKIFLARCDTIRKAIARLHRPGANGELLYAPRTCSIFETTVTLAEHGYRPTVNGITAWALYPVFTGKDSRTASDRPLTLCINRTLSGNIKQYLGTGTLSFFSNTADLRR